jgi:hypothetical protein
MISNSARLRIKPIYPIYRVDATTFRIGAQRGLTREFRDPFSQLWQLVHIADGSKDVHAVIALMQEKFPALTPDDIRGGLARLEAEGLLEDARLSDFRHEHLSRFEGTANHFRHYGDLDADPWLHLKKLQESHVTLLGLGGGGSTILPLLIALGIGTITAVDYDRVELSNLNRQFLYTEADIGELKTSVADRIVRQLNSATRFRTVTCRLDSAEQVLEQVADADLVVCAIDEPPFLAQRRVNAACVAAGVPCVYGGSQVTRGRMWTVLPRISGCFDCLHVHYTKTDPRFANQFHGFHELDFDPPTIAFPPDILRLGSAIAGEVARLLTGYLPPVSIGKQVELDFASGSTEVVTEWPRYGEECPTCGTGSEESWPAFAAYKGSVWRSESARRAVR